MDATPRYPVVQYDGTNQDTIMAVLGGPYYRFEQRTDDQGAPVLALWDWWENETLLPTTAFCVDRRIFADRAELDGSYYVLPEGS